MRKTQKLQLYLETTVFNYYFDEDRQGHHDVVKLLEAIGAGLFEGYASDFVTEELKVATEPKRSNMLSLIEKYGIITLWPRPEVMRLADRYLESGIIPASQRLDSLHIAIASVYELDCLISYNFRRINRDKARIFTAITNEDEGYKGIRICTAGEVLSDDWQDGYA